MDRVTRLVPAALAALLLALAAGCAPETGEETPAPTPTATESPAAAGPAVYTDYSKLEPLQKHREVYVRYWGEPRFQLTPSPDYGPLIPFPANVLSGHWVSWNYEEWGEEGTDSYTDQLYGLMTLEGKVVVEPVYNRVTDIVVKNSAGEYGTYPGARVYTQYDPDSPTRYRHTLSANDGSWTTGPVYIDMYPVIGDEYEPYYGYYGYDGEALFARREGMLVLLDPYTGRELVTLPLPEELSGVPWFACNLGEDIISLSYSFYDEDDYKSGLLCWDMAGNSISLPQEIVSLYSFQEGMAVAWTGEGCGFIDREGRWVLPPRYKYAQEFENGRALVRNEEGYFFINPAGHPITDPVAADHVFHTGEYWIFTGYQWDAGLVLDGELQPVDSPLLYQGYVRTWEDGWASVETGEGTLLVKGKQSWTLPDGFYLSEYGGQPFREDGIFLYRDGGSELWLWTPADGGLVPLPADDPSRPGNNTDPITGEIYRRVRDDSYSTTELQDAEGNALFRADDCQDFYGDGQPTLVGGCCLCGSYDSRQPTVLLDPDGRVLMLKYWNSGLD